MIDPCERLRIALGRAGYDPAGVAELMDGFAHALAEQIRNVPVDYMVGTRDKNLLADLIDPWTNPPNPDA